MGKDLARKRRKLDLLRWLYDGRCFWCGVAIPVGEHPHKPMAISIDELLARASGGFRVLANQVPAHRICNMRRGNTKAPREAIARHHAVLKAAGIEFSER